MKNILRKYVADRPMLTHWRKLQHFEGWRHTLYRAWMERRILRSKPVRTQRASRDGKPQCEIHVLTRDVEIAMTLWSLKSFYFYSGVDWPLVFHQGGRLRDKDLRRLKQHFPDAHIFGDVEADALVEPALIAGGFNRCLEVRRDPQMPFLKKLLDVVVLSSAENVLLVDSDVLFFEEPTELMTSAESYVCHNRVNRQSMNGYTLSREVAMERYGVRLAEWINAGLSLVRRESIPVMEVERILKDPDVTCHAWLTEQTVYGLISSKIGVDFLPDRYVATFGDDPGLKTADGDAVISKHYFKHPRPLMFEEGMHELVRRGFLRDQKKNPLGNRRNLADTNKESPEQELAAVGMK